MESTKLSALLILFMVSLSSSPLALACGSSCTTPPSSGGTPAINLPPVTLPPVTVPKLPIVGGGSPGVNLPPVIGGSGSPGVTVPKLPIVGGGSPGVTVPKLPIVGGGSPGVTLPPIIGGGGSPPKYHRRKGCPPPPSPPTPTPSPPSETCPIDALKLGACVDLLGHEVHIGDTNVKCCSLVQGVAGAAAAACLCTTIKAKLLDLSVYVPLALKLLVNCGCSVPPGYTCA